MGKNELISNYLWKSEQGGAFSRAIIKAISLADLRNLGKLYQSFPNLVDGYLLYTKDKTFKDLSKEV